jgi:hypothetical protein
MPLPKDDEEARKSRAARLREQIDELTSGKAPAGSPAEKAEPSPPPSARDFIQDKMKRDRKT